MRPGVGAGHGPVQCRALGAMYKQPHRAFKIAAALGCWWQATNGILQGCPLSVILVNVLAKIWKWEVDSLRRQVCAWTAALPPTPDVEAAADLKVGATPPQGRRSRLRRAGVVGLCRQHPGGGPGGGLPSGDGPRVAAGHGPRRASGQVLLLGSGGTGRPGCPTPGRPNPAADTFRQLGVDVAIGGSRTTGPMPSRRLEAGRSALRRLPHLPTYDRRERAISTLVTPLALHGVAVASMTDPNLRGLETAVMRALCGATRLSRAKEIVFSVLSTLETQIKSNIFNFWPKIN